jgi:hypothetical protein
MSPDKRLMCGISLILIPTIVYGGLTILGVISNGAFGTLRWEEFQTVSQGAAVSPVPGR